MTRWYGSTDIDEDHNKRPLYQVTGVTTGGEQIERLVHATDEEAAKQKVFAPGFQMRGITISHIVKVQLLGSS